MHIHKDPNALVQGLAPSIKDILNQGLGELAQQLEVDGPVHQAAQRLQQAIVAGRSDLIEIIRDELLQRLETQQEGVLDAAGGMLPTMVNLGLGLLFQGASAGIASIQIK